MPSANTTSPRKIPPKAERACELPSARKFAPKNPEPFDGGVSDIGKVTHKIFLRQSPAVYGHDDLFVLYCLWLLS